jgi:hypothetical protein
MLGSELISSPTANYSGTAGGKTELCRLLDAVVCIRTSIRKGDDLRIASLRSKQKGREISRARERMPDLTKNFSAAGGYEGRRVMR